MVNHFKINEKKDVLRVLNVLLNKQQLKKPNMLIIINGTTPKNLIFPPLVHEIKQGLTAIASKTQAWVLGECNFDDQIYSLIESALYEGSDSENIPFISFLKDKSNKNMGLKSKRIKNAFFIESSYETNHEILIQFCSFLRKNLPYSYYKSEELANNDDIPFKIPILLIIINGELEALDALLEAFQGNKSILVIKVIDFIELNYF